MGQTPDCVPICWALAQLALEILRTGVNYSGAMDYFYALKPKGYVSVDTRALSEDGLYVLEGFGLDTLAWSFEVAERVVAAILASVPSLSGEATQSPVFMRGVRSSVLRILRMAAGETELTPITDEAQDVARDFARRGLELGELMKSHRIGVPEIAAAHIESTLQLLSGPDAAVELQRLSKFYFAWLQEFSDQMHQAYLEEQSRWQLGRAAENLSIVNSVLSNRQVDITTASERLGYDLHGQHVASIAWADSFEPDLLDSLTESLREEFRSLRARDVLIVPVGLNEVWGWGRLDSIDASSASTPLPRVHVATGQPGLGLNGFRHSHEEARAVQHLLRNAPSYSDQAVRHHEVELAAILCSNVEKARNFVQRSLGRLATRGEREDKIRETLWLYLTNERSVLAVSKQQFISRNTVTYRIKQAEQDIGRNLEKDRLNIQTALFIASLLKERVLPDMG